MPMFCFQCQETLRNEGCTQYGMCGKPGTCSNLMDVLIYSLRGLALAVEISNAPIPENVPPHIIYSLFTTITNSCFEELKIESLIRKTLILRNEIIRQHEETFVEYPDDILFWNARSRKEFLAKSPQASPLIVHDTDIRSLRELLTFGMKGISAYAWHAMRLGFEDDEISRFLIRGLAETAPMVKYDTGALLAMIKECGNTALTAMKILNEAHTHHFGIPRPATVSTQTGKRPGILVTGHDFKDLEDLLAQSAGQGIDIYTHGEMLPAHAYPNLKKYPHLIANYGGAWWRQNHDFRSFNGPVLVTSNCLAPVHKDYKNRIFTTGPAGWPGLRHIPEPQPGKMKNFSEIIQLAKTLPHPQPPYAPTNTAEPKEIVTGCGLIQLSEFSDDVISGLKSGEIENIFVIAGCDGRHINRRFYEEFAEKITKKSIILTAGCQKYRLNKKDYGKIGNLPRLLDAGQCGDIWVIMDFLLKITEKMNLPSINDLPLNVHFAWLEQKSTAILLALLAAGIKNITLGPTYPAFFSPNIIRFLKENYGLKKFQNPEIELRNLEPEVQITINLEEILL